MQVAAAAVYQHDHDRPGSVISDVRVIIHVNLNLKLTMSATPSGNTVTVTTGVPLALASGNLKVTSNYENEDRAQAGNVQSESR